MVASREVWLVKSLHRHEVVPDDVGTLELQPLGSLDEVRAAVGRVFPEITWLDPWTAVVDGDGWMAEVSIRVGRPTQELTIRIHGRLNAPESALGFIKSLCADNGWRGIDLDRWEFIA